MKTMQILNLKSYHPEKGVREKARKEVSLQEKTVGALSWNVRRAMNRPNQKKLSQAQTSAKQKNDLQLEEINAKQIHACFGTRQTSRKKRKYQKPKNTRNYFHSLPQRHLPPFQWEHFDFLHFFFLLTTTCFFPQAITRGELICIQCTPKIQRIPTDRSKSSHW